MVIWAPSYIARFYFENINLKLGGGDFKKEKPPQ